MHSQNKTLKIHLKNFFLDLDRAILANPLVMLMLLGHFVFSALFIQKGLIDQLSSIEATLYFVKGFLYTAVLYLFLDRLITQLGSIFLRLIFQLFFVVGFFVLEIFHFLSGAALDFPLLAYNFKEIFNKDAFISIFVSVNPLVYIGLFAGLILFAWYLKKIFKPTIYKSSIYFLGLFASIFALNLSYVSPSSCPYTYFLQTTVNSFRQNSSIDTSSPLPYWKETNLTGIDKSFLPHPNVFILIVESFSSEFFKTQTPDGRSYTPFLNELAKNSLIIPNFYSTSIQTARSQFAIFCGIPAGFKKKEFTDHLNLNLNCLPSILKTNGYETFFFKAYDDINFDNTAYFAQKMGFDVQKGMDKSFITPADSPFIWGWGIQDDKFFEKFFAYLDKNKVTNSPILASLTTVTNHMMFDHVPPDIRPLYKEPKSVKENYANTINLTDKYISVFFEELKKRPQFKNSIVIITGDNGYPVGQHQLYHNESGYYDEFFKTPLIVHSLDQKLASLPSKSYASHIDIAPSVLDILGIKSKTHFIGESIFSQNDEARVINMSQPYAGGYIILRKQRYKYVKNLTYNIEYLYDTDVDSLERQNLIYENDLQPVVESLRVESQKAMLNQVLIEQNRLAPPMLSSHN